MVVSAAMIVFRTYRRNISWHVVANSFIAVYLGAHFIYYLFERKYGKLMGHSSLFFSPSDSFISIAALRIGHVVADRAKEAD